MKNFKLEAKVTISIFTEVEAETLEEAKKIAEDRTIEKGQWQTKNQSKEVWVADEYDGEPFEVVEEED